MCFNYKPPVRATLWNPTNSESKIPMIWIFGPDDFELLCTVVPLVSYYGYSRKWCKNWAWGIKDVNFKVIKYTDTKVEFLWSLTCFFRVRKTSLWVGVQTQMRNASWCKSDQIRLGRYCQQPLVPMLTVIK